jgi:hypothetical protein
MALHLDGQVFEGLHLGDINFEGLYLGDQRLWSLTNLRDDFTGDGDLDPALWVREQAGTFFDIGRTDDTARVQIPDGILSVTWGFQTSKYRFIGGQSAADDGHLEFRIANKGTGGYATHMYRRYANAGGATGVYVGMHSSDLFIGRRAAGVNTRLIECGAFDAGDVIRFVQKGNLHSVYRQGEFAGEWEDVGNTAAVGAANRSIAMLMQGEKAIFMPREFSPSIDYFEAS